MQTLVVRFPKILNRPVRNFHSICKKWLKLYFEGRAQLFFCLNDLRWQAVMVKLR